MEPEKHFWKARLGTKWRVGDHGYYYVIIPDHSAGKKGRYTIYKIPGTPAKRIKIIGRELTWGFSLSPIIKDQYKSC